MESDEKILYAVRYLLAKSLDENITSEEARRLDELIVSNPAARRYYVEFLQVHTSLRRLHEEAAAGRTEQDSRLFDARLWQELANHEMTAEAVAAIEEEEAEPPLPHPALVTPERQKPSKFSVYALVASMAAMLVMAIYIHVMPSPKRVVATFTDAVNCRWADTGRALQKGDEVLDETRVLASGFVALRFDSGVEVVVEGPARFCPLTTDKMRLDYGKAFASVPETAIGFTIDSPQSSVVDLGTEFGVAVDTGGGSEVHVYKGKVNLVAGLAAHPKTSEILQQHEARKVDAAKGSIRSAEFKEFLFAQKISSRDNRVEYGRPLSLTDLVMGGNGHGTSLETREFYAVSTGQKLTDSAREYRTVDGSYRKVTANPFIDGLFVPNGPNQVVSSEGHTFAECPETSGFYYYDLCFDRSWNYAPSVAERFQKRRNLNRAPEVAFMHSNLGVTFDLEAVRRQFPGQSIRRFQAAVGTLSSCWGFTVLTPEQLALDFTEFDVWIVVDGQFRAKAERVRWNSLIDLDVPLTPKDRFLSVMVTDGGVIRSPGNNANHYDLCGLADMRFEMESMD